MVLLAGGGCIVLLFLVSLSSEPTEFPAEDGIFSFGRRGASFSGTGQPTKSGLTELTHQGAKGVEFRSQCCRRGRLLSFLLFLWSSGRWSGKRWALYLGSRSVSLVYLAVGSDLVRMPESNKRQSFIHRVKQSVYFPGELEEEIHSTVNPKNIKELSQQHYERRTDF